MDRGSAGVEAEINRLAAEARTTLKRERDSARERLEERSPSGPRARGRRRRLWTLAAALAGISLLLTGINIAGPGVTGSRVLDPAWADRERRLGYDMLYVANALIARQASTGSLPMTLAEAGIDEAPVIAYERVSINRFRVVGQDGGTSLTFDSDLDPKRFLLNYGVRR